MKKILFVILSLCILLCSCNKESISLTENQQDGTSEKLQFEENQNEQVNLEDTENEFNIDDYQIQIPAEPVLHVYPIELGGEESSKKCSCSSCENLAQCIACPYVIIGGSEVEVEESYLCKECYEKIAKSHRLKDIFVYDAFFMACYIAASDADVKKELEEKGKCSFVFNSEGIRMENVSSHINYYITKLLPDYSNFVTAEEYKMNFGVDQNGTYIGPNLYLDTIIK